MKRFYRLRIVLLAVLAGVPGVLGGVALAAPESALKISEVKVSGDEFVVLRATQPIDDLSAYWVGYTGSDTATTIVPTQQLPTEVLAAGQAILLTSDGAPTCDAAYVTRLSASLGDSKGTLVVRRLENAGATSTFTTIDSVSWVKPAASAPTPSASIDMRKEAASIDSPVWYQGDDGSWRVGDFKNCTLTLAAGDTSGPGSVSWPQSSVDPPATIESLAAGDSANGPTLPPVDAGLAAPQITEMLPNPAGTGNDASDEFIELYNPNASAFDLTGFVLQTGATTKHSFTLKAGTLLPPKSFVSFSSADTGLSLSNSGGSADLLDPFGSSISQSDPYGTAKDGMAWALAKGTWFWTSQPTPGAANVVNQASSATTSKSKKSGATTKGSVKGAQTTSSTSPAGAPTNALQVTPVHSWALASVAILAVAYGVYEYRLDLANLINRFRKHRADRRADRQSA